ncbi:RimK/LysX family protein [Marinobacterium iners]|uniref:putative ATP-dependent zinc protease n=1 Tax=Marinobacterium iners TaxID=48076 RepID=UPI002676409F|nr:RimK/LysX family protein [Marinobacterium iners]
MPKWDVDTSLNIAPSSSFNSGSSTTHTAEVTLTNRNSMGFRMLIGRTTMKGHYLVDPGQSYLLRKTRKQT